MAPLPKRPDIPICVQFRAYLRLSQSFNQEKNTYGIAAN
jgi:hypothetical protein